MTKLNEVYKCSVCGNIVTVVHASFGTLVCCGKNMDLLEANTVDAAQEKHVPVIEKPAPDKIIVKVGSVEHPMEKEHYIEFIQIIADGKSYIKFLNPGDEPEAEFCVEANEILAREYCNLHGLWKADWKIV